MADLTDDQIARLREVASTEGPGHMYAAWRQLNAVLDEIDRLRDERATVSEILATHDPNPPMAYPDVEHDDDLGGWLEGFIENAQTDLDRLNAELIATRAQRDDGIYQLTTENDRLREENTALGVRWAEQHDRAERTQTELDQLGKLADLLRQQRDGLAQDVRAEAYGLEGLPHGRPDMLAQLADRLHQACARAGGEG